MVEGKVIQQSIRVWRKKFSHQIGHEIKDESELNLGDRLEQLEQVRYQVSLINTNSSDSVTRNQMRLVDKVKQCVISHTFILRFDVNFPTKFLDFLNSTMFITFEASSKKSKTFLKRPFSLTYSSRFGSFARLVLWWWTHLRIYWKLL